LVVLRASKGFGMHPRLVAGLLAAYGMLRQITGSAGFLPYRL